VVQATETVKLILGKGEPLIGRLLTYDALGMRFREVRLRRDPKCPLCGEAPTIRDLSPHAATSEAACAIAPAAETASAAAHHAAVAASPAFLGSTTAC
jgi:adenylyltransferase/sulfurtransferase